MGWELSRRGAAAFMWQLVQKGGHGVFNMLIGWMWETSVINAAFGSWENEGKKRRGRKGGRKGSFPSFGCAMKMGGKKNLWDPCIKCFLRWRRRKQREKPEMWWKRRWYPLPFSMFSSSLSPRTTTSTIHLNRHQTSSKPPPSGSVKL